MKIKFLGTAAAEGIPGLFCTCETCQKARKLGGRNLRFRSQALIDDALLIDFGPDTLTNSLRFHIDLATLEHCLVTHDHRDHFYSMDLYNTYPGMSQLPQNKHFRIYSNPEVIEKVDLAAMHSRGYLEGIRIEPFVPFQAGKHTVTALKARHGTDNPYVYIISDGEKTLLYAHDTDIFREETWEYLKTSGLKFDLVTMDCTEGAMEDIPYHGHMCLGRNVQFKNLLIEAGLADENTVFVSNHFSHNGKDACYDDYAPQAEKFGLLTSFDGMEIEF